MLSEIILFHPYYKQVIWGGERIAALKGIPSPCERVGESWEISALEGRESVAEGGECDGMPLSEIMRRHGHELMGNRVCQEFPLLVKIIDAREDLSLQVHPDDQLARTMGARAGKSEMWYVVEAEPEARLLAGLSAPLDPEGLRRRISDGTIGEVVSRHDTAPGQFYYLPAGTLHSIGRGNLIVEVQQTSDETYRVYDYGRDRPLHTDLASRAIDYAFPHRVSPAGCIPVESQDGVVECEHFRVDYRQVSSGASQIHEGDSFTIVICVDGEAILTPEGDRGRTLRLKRGHTALIPACLKEVTAQGPAKLLLVK